MRVPRERGSGLDREPRDHGARGSSAFTTSGGSPSRLIFILRSMSSVNTARPLRNSVAMGGGGTCAANSTTPPMITTAAMTATVRASTRFLPIVGLEASVPGWDRFPRPWPWSRPLGVQSFHHRCDGPRRHLLRSSSGGGVGYPGGCTGWMRGALERDTHDCTSVESPVMERGSLAIRFSQEPLLFAGSRAIVREGVESLGRSSTVPRRGCCRNPSA
jgi:hypothetical protein